MKKLNEWFIDFVVIPIIDWILLPILWVSGFIGCGILALSETIWEYILKNVKKIKT